MRAVAYIFLNPTSGFWLRRALAPIARNPLFDVFYPSIFPYPTIIANNSAHTVTSAIRTKEGSFLPNRAAQINSPVVATPHRLDRVRTVSRVILPGQSSSNMASAANPPVMITGNHAQ